MSLIAKAAGHFTETEIDAEVVVMNLDTGDFFSLTGTAREVWRLIDGTRDREALIDELAQAYGTDPATLAGDVDAFLCELRGASLLAAG